MKVMVLKTDERLGIKAGEVYEAQRYRYDFGKWTLLSRVLDGYDPSCNQYGNEIAFLIRGIWHVVDGGIFVSVGQIIEYSHREIRDCVACPKCGVTAGNHCVQPNGRKVGKAHKEREKNLLGDSQFVIKKWLELEE